MISAESESAVDPYADWDATVEAVLNEGGSALLIGAMDVGKTTLTRLLVNRAVANGMRVALIDTDPGQSEIGPPGCVGLAYVDAPVESLSDLTPQALAFVGNTSPASHLLEHAAGTARLAAIAGDRMLIVDTCGYIQGGGARRLHQTEFDLLQPAHVIALQRQGELEPILAPLRHRTNCRVHTPPIPTGVTRKSPGLRSQRRAMRFASYFETTTLHTFSFDEVALVGTWLGGSDPLPPHLLKFLNQALGYHARIYHAELCDRVLGLMVSRPLPPDAAGFAMVQEQLKQQSIAITVAPNLRHLLLGLESGNGKLLGLGLLEALDFRRRTLGIRTPVRTPQAAHILRFGTLRLTPDGKELGSLRPGDL
jgi:polynucleotide 5'-hydroxyl-kinase GRC3/NOL9